MKFIIEHIPAVQKNDLIIKKMFIKGKSISAIGHSKRLIKTREYTAETIYNQYISQGFTKPINYLFVIRFKFYVRKVREPDLDNLPSMYLDAMQGIKIKKGKNKGIIIYKILEDDKLNRDEHSTKIVEGDKKYYGKPRTEISIGPYI